MTLATLAIISSGAAIAMLAVGSCTSGRRRALAWGCGAVPLVVAVVAAAVSLPGYWAQQDARAGQHEQMLLAATTSAERALAGRYGRFSTCMTDLALIAPALAASRTGDYAIAVKLAPATHRLLLTADSYSNSSSVSRSAVIDAGATPVSSC